MTKLRFAIAALAAMNTAAHSTATADQWIAICSKGISPSCESYAFGVAGRGLGHSSNASGTINDLHSAKSMWRERI
jgi:hypothetical protein